MDKSLNRALCVLCYAAACLCAVFVALLVFELFILYRTQASAQAFFPRAQGVVRALHAGGPAAD